MAKSGASDQANQPGLPTETEQDVGFRPLYKQVKDAIIQRLVSGDWRPGDKLPSEFELAARYRVSQGTLRKALDELTAQNLLVRQQGRGTYVATHNPHRALFHFFHFVGKDESRQLPTSRVLDLTVRRASKVEEERLALKPGSRVIHINRVRDMGGRPAIVEWIIVSAKLFSGLAKVPIDQLPNTLYQLYESDYGVMIYQAEERLSAVAADAHEAELLGIEPGHPLQEVDRLAMSIDRRPIEWRVSHCLTGEYRYLSILD